MVVGDVRTIRGDEKPRNREIASSRVAQQQSRREVQTRLRFSAKGGERAAPGSSSLAEASAWRLSATDGRGSLRRVREAEDGLIGREDGGNGCQPICDGMTETERQRSGMLRKESTLEPSAKVRDWRLERLAILNAKSRDYTVIDVQRD